MTPTATRLLKTACIVALAALGSDRLVQAQLPQAVGTWSLQGSVADPRVGAASIVLDDGRTLVLGGRLADGSITNSVVVYDPVANGATAAGQLLAARVHSSAALLEDGRVVVSGGHVGSEPSADVEIFDPVAGTSTFAATMATPRAWHASARLPDGSVLLVGGVTSGGAALATAEIYDPVAASVSPAGTMATARVGLSATALLQGHVLIAGGNDGGQDLASAEIFDPFTGNVFVPVPTSMSVARSGHTAVLLKHNAGVLIAGGIAAGATVNSTDLFLPAIFPDPYSWGIGSFDATGPMTAPRAFAFSGPAGDNGLAYVAGGGADLAEAYRHATITTDKDDYAPGEPAIITGSGWQPGETVTLTFQEDPAVHDDYVLPVVADANGNIFWDQWAPELHDLYVRFYLTAAGSRSRAQTTFTDALKSTATIAPSSATVGVPTIFSLTVLNESTSPQVNLQCVSVNMPAGVTITGTPVVSNAWVATLVGSTLSASGSTVLPAGTVVITFTATSTTAASKTFTTTAFGQANCSGQPHAVTNNTTVTMSSLAESTTVANPATATYGDSSVLLSAAVNSTLPVNVGTFTFTVKQGATIIGIPTTSGTVTAGNASVSYALPPGTAAGVYSIEANYSGGTGVSPSTGSDSLTINQRAVTVLTQPASKTYGGADPIPLTTADVSVFLAADAITATFARAPGDTVGPYAITTTLVDPNSRLANYSVTNAGATFTINAKPVTVITQPASKIYGEADPDPLTTAGLSVFLAADGITATFARAAGDTVGPYVITTTLVDPNGRLANYSVTNGGATFTITAKPVTVITQPASKIYGEADPDPLTTADLSSFLAADGITATFARAAGDTVGPYAITTTLVDPNSRLPNYNVTNAGATFTINPRLLTVTATGVNRLYDGTTTATVNLAHNALAGDDVTVAYGAASFANKNAGSGKPISVTGISITGGADGANYTLNGVYTTSTTADISQRPLSITAVTDTRVYNGTNSSAGVPTVGMLYDTDTVTGRVQTFDNKNVGTGKTLAVSAYIVNDGNGGGNYVVSTAANTTGVITQKTLDVTGITANNKPFDGNTTAALNVAGAALAGVIAPDAVTLVTAGATGTFSSPAVGTWTVTIAGLTLGGSDADNYYIYPAPITTASITAWTLSGFLQPVGVQNTYPTAPGAPLPALQPNTIWNTIKGGQTVPLKFELFTTAGGTELTSVSDVLGFALVGLPCMTGWEDPVDPDFTTQGATVLRYSDGQYIQNWETPKGANKCYRVTMTARDGSQLSAFFKTK